MAGFAMDSTSLGSSEDDRNVVSDPSDSDLFDYWQKDLHSRQSDFWDLVTEYAKVSSCDEEDTIEQAATLSDEIVLPERILAGVDNHTAHGGTVTATNITDSRPTTQPPSTAEADTAELVNKVFTVTLSALLRATNAVTRTLFCNSLPPPTPLVNVLAFFPPAPFKYYCLSYRVLDGDDTTQSDDDDLTTPRSRRQIANAAMAFGQEDIRFEPVVSRFHQHRVYITGLRVYLRRTNAFVVHSKSGNYIVGVKVSANFNLNPHKVVLVANSNACDLGLTISPAVKMVPDDFDAYFFDYSGYGLSSGSPSESAVNADIEAIYEYIRCERNDPYLKVILVGFSIGSTVVADFASRQCETSTTYVAGVVLVAPLTSAIRHCVRNKKLEQTSSLDCFRTIDKVEKINVPFLCIHGLEDEMMPPSNSIELSNRAPRAVEPFFIPNRGHLCVVKSALYLARLHYFINIQIDQTIDYITY